MSCLFCRIAKGEIPSTKVYEDDRILAFKDIDPQAPVHVLIIPKEHIDSVMDLNESNKDIVAHIFMCAKEVAEKSGIAEDGFRIVTNTGDSAGQSVKHLHFHLLGGRSLQWPPG